MEALAQVFKTPRGLAHSLPEQGPLLRAGINSTTIIIPTKNSSLEGANSFAGPWSPWPKMQVYLKFTIGISPLGFRASRLTILIDRAPKFET